MLKTNKIGKRFGLFILLYFGLIILFQWKPLQQAHNVYYCSVGDRIFNMINPNYYAVFSPEAPPNEKDWNTTISIYNRAKHNGRISNNFYRSQTNPDRLFYRNLYELTILPSLFLLSLFICTPVLSWKKKTLYFFISLFILYIFLSFHYSHIFENLIMNNNKIGDNFWSKFVSIFGFRGLTEPLYIISVVTWAMFTFRAPLWRWLVDQDEPT